MNTLYTPTKIVGHCRDLMNDRVEPYFVSDETMLEFLNRTVRDVAEDKLLFPSGRFAPVKVKANNPWVAVYPQVIKPRVFVSQADGRLLPCIPYSRIEDEHWYTDYGLRLDSKWRMREGRPDCVVCDLDRNFWRFVPSPIEDESYELEAWVYPDAVTSLDCSMNVEDRVAQHLHLGMLAEAFNIEDADAIYDAKKAGEYAERWADAKAMLAARYQRDSRDGGRTVRYGGY